MRMAEGEEPPAVPPVVEEEEIVEAAAAPKSNQFKVKIDKSGAGFNQFDPVLSTTSFISRRFGLVGGLGVVALLAATEGKEIVQALFAEGAVKGTDEVTTTKSGLSYVDGLVGPDSASAVEAGKLIGLNVEVQIADQSFKKAVAFTYGDKVYKSVVCKGLEEGIMGMHVGGTRTITMPIELGPPNIRLPPGTPLVYKVELTEVFTNYLQ